MSVTLALLACKTQPDHSSAILTKDDNDRMVTNVMIDGQGPFPFIVDTGAPMSCISHSLAERLSLPRVPMVQVQIQGSAGEEASSMYIARNYSSAVFARHLERMVGLSRSSVVAYGVLGMNAFANGQLIFDFAHRSLSVHDSQASPGEVIKGSLQSTDMAVDVDVDGVVTKAFIDTGARRTIANTALMRALSINTGDLPETDPIEGATKDKMSARLVRVSSLRLGSVRFPNPALVVADLRLFERRGLGNSPALVLGVDLLSTLKVMTVDYPRSELYIQP